MSTTTTSPGGSASIRVGRLVVRPVGDGRLGGDVVARLRAEALLADLRPALDGDRAILVLRRLHWPVDRLTAAGARAMLAEQRRGAARPARDSSVAARRDAVLFADDVELLTCLTRDALSGELAQWYWRRLVGSPGGRAGPGAVLASAWTDRARWVPALLAGLPGAVARRAVSTLTPVQAARVRAAISAEFGDDSAGGPGGGSEPVLVATGATAAARVRSARPAGPDQASAAVAARPPALMRLAPGALAGLDLQQQALLGVALALSAPAGGTGPSAVLHDVEDWVQAIETGAAESGQDGGDALPTADPSDRLDEARAEPVRGARDRRPGADAAADPSSGVEEAGPVDALAECTDSAFASVLYLINLLPWLELADVAPGWPVLELLARQLLSAEQAPEADPLWGRLAEWGGRARPAAESANDSIAGLVADLGVDPEWVDALATRARRLLVEHGVDTAALSAPGRLVATATHVDVVLELERIDLAVRRCGLDRDPGWQPALGRIVAFHFDSRA